MYFARKSPKIQGHTVNREGFAYVRLSVLRCLVADSCHPAVQRVFCSIVTVASISSNFLSVGMRISPLPSVAAAQALPMWRLSASPW